MKRPSNEIDVIILGSGLGGLVAGTLLSREKCSVLLLKEKKHQSVYTQTGYQFIPFSNFLERRLKSPLVQLIFETLSLSLRNGRPHESGKNPKWGVAFQVILPKARIDVFDRRSLLQKEWRREFPKEISQIEKFYSEMDLLLMKTRNEVVPRSLFSSPSRSAITHRIPFKTFQERKMNKRLSSFSKEFKELIKLQLISRGNLNSDQLPVTLCAYLLLDDEPNVSLQGVDLRDLEKDFSERYLQAGGKIKEVELLEKVDGGWRKGFAVSLGKDQEMYRSRSLILNLPLHQGKNLFGKRWKGLSTWAKRIEPEYLFFPFFLGIREKAVPVGMKELLVSILDLKKPYEGGNVLFLSLSPKGDETKAPEGRRALTVESLLPFGKWDQGSLAEHRKGVMGHLEHLFPFLEEQIEFSDWSGIGEPVPGWSDPRFLYDVTFDFDWQQGVVPRQISRNLYFVGKESFPYLGMEGEILTGRVVAQMILKKHRP